MLEWFLKYSDTIVPVFSIVAMARLKKLHRQEWLLLVYSVVCIIIFGYSNYLADRVLNNMYLYHFFSLFEFLIIILYAAPLFNSKKAKIFLPAITILYFLYWVVNIWMWEPLTVFNSNSASIACLLILIVCGMYFLSLSSKKELLYFQKLPQFWVMTAFVFYCACSIPIILSYKYPEMFYDFNTDSAWKIQIVANCIKFVLLSYAVLCSYKYRVGL
jgi:hypothetical protein